jgi:Zn-finger nucleic acid-binding protein
MRQIRRCPVCAEEMNSETQFGVCVDLCEEHGIWLDKGELESLLSRKEGRWRERVEAVQTRASSDRWKWLFWGVLWS